MARSDLLVSLVKAGSSGDATRARSVAEAIIAEERAKQHNVLAERLTEAMRANGARPATARFAGDGQRHREFLLELTLAGGSRSWSSPILPGARATS